jgi:uncharacterized protein YkwD
VTIMFPLLMLAAGAVATALAGGRKKAAPGPVSEAVRATNQVRKQAGLSPLRVNLQLAQIAKAYVLDQQKRGFGGHYSPEGEGFVERLQRGRYSGLARAENIAEGYQSGTSVVMDGWMQSPSHAQNILLPDVTEIGIGFVLDPMRGGLWAQVFGRRR